MKKNFDTWARELAPEMSPDEMSRKAHLAVLKDRMRTMEKSRQRRHARVRKASMVAVFVCFTFLGGYVSELGSDNFAVMSQGQYVREDGIVSDVLEIGHAGHIVAGDSLDVEMVLDMVDQMEAGFGRPHSIQLIEVEGQGWWSKYFEYDFPDGPQVQYTHMQDRPDDVPEVVQHIIVDKAYRKWATDVKNGLIEEDRTFFEVMDGDRYLCREYNKTIPGFGAVKIYRGVYAPEG